MFKSKTTTSRYETLEQEIQVLIDQLGDGTVRGVAYDTAWVARLGNRFPGNLSGHALEWLRRNQYEDGSWGGPLVQYHDRFVSTLAAIVALREARCDPRDERRVQRGENALWKMVGRLGQDDSDTIGFPVIAAALAREAAALGLDVPMPPIRFASAYQHKVKALLTSPDRNWSASTLVFSMEALRDAVHASDKVLAANGSVASSPAATAAYLLTGYHPDESASLRYLASIQQPDGSIPDVAPIDLFEIAWSLNHLRLAGAITPDTPSVRRLFDYLWESWSPATGVSYSTYFSVDDSDVTAASFTVLKWAGYPVKADTFEHYENNDHFKCYPGETNPALSAHVRLLAALRTCDEHPRYPDWVSKIINTLHRFDENGSYWWDKWHVSPYYVSGVALNTLHDLDNDLTRSRLKWILRTQNDDGGWGYLGTSTPEETAYCLEALVRWHTQIDRVDPTILEGAADYLWHHLDDYPEVPLWIGKSLYHPVGPVRAAVLGALYSYTSALL